MDKVTEYSPKCVDIEAKCGNCGKQWAAMVGQRGFYTEFMGKKKECPHCHKVAVRYSLMYHQ